MLHSTGAENLFSAIIFYIKRDGGKFYDLCCLCVVSLQKQYFVNYCNIICPVLLK